MKWKGFGSRPAACRSVILGCTLLCVSAAVWGQVLPRATQPGPAGEGEKELAIVELGAAMNWDTAGGAATFAPNLAVETTPVENWLEVEAGVSRFSTRRSTEWDTDFLFKKPWTLSRKAEFMVGVGPQWSHTRQDGVTADTFAAELAGDFMFWPARRHQFGWFLEPAYDYSFAGGHPQSVGISGGLLITIP